MSRSEWNIVVVFFVCIPCAFISFTRRHHNNNKIPIRIMKHPGLRISGVRKEDEK